MHGNKGEDLLKDASPANSEFDNEIDEIDVKLEWKSICPIWKHLQLSFEERPNPSKNYVWKPSSYTNYLSKSYLSKS